MLYLHYREYIIEIQSNINSQVELYETELEAALCRDVSGSVGSVAIPTVSSIDGVIGSLENL